MNSVVDAFVGLGANLGDAARALVDAVHALDGLPSTRCMAASRFYRTPAWGITDQPDFVNAVAHLRTSLTPRALLDALLAIECNAGRVRGEGQQWGPRVLDLDILLFGDEVLDVPGLHIPHPRLHERAFALIPLQDVAPRAVIPGLGGVADVLARLDIAEIARLHLLDHHTTGFVEQSL